MALIYEGLCKLTWSGECDISRRVHFDQEEEAEGVEVCRGPTN